MRSRAAALAVVALACPVAAETSLPYEAQCAAYWFGFAERLGNEEDRRVGRAFRQGALEKAPERAADVTGFIETQSALIARTFDAWIDLRDEQSAEVLRMIAARCDALEAEMRGTPDAPR